MQANFGFKAGDAIKVFHPTYVHYGIVSDRIGPDGHPMIIDHSMATGTVAERSWGEATGGKTVSKSDLDSDRSPYQIILAARQLIGKAKYSLTHFNCEAFVRHVMGLSPTSKQVTASVVSVPLAGIIAYKASAKNPWITALACLTVFAVTTHAVAE